MLAAPHPCSSLCCCIAQRHRINALPLSARLRLAPAAALLKYRKISIILSLGHAFCSTAGRRARFRHDRNTRVQFRYDSGTIRVHFLQSNGLAGSDRGTIPVHDSAVSLVVPCPLSHAFCRCRRAKTPPSLFSSAAVLERLVRTVQRRSSNTLSTEVFALSTP